MNFNNIDEIKKAGFSGFKKISELLINSSLIPKIKGVYLILDINNRTPVFLEMGTGGHFKGKNPNVIISKLEENWVADTVVVYIGKAGKNGSNVTLQSRLKQYFSFGQGKNIGHWGGRFIWQLRNSNDLIVCWKELPLDDPRTIESGLIRQFVKIYSKRPFANLAY